MFYRKLTAVLLAFIVILSCSSCSKSTKPTAVEDASSEEETSSFINTEATDSILSTDFVSIPDTSSATTTETTVVSAQSTTTTKATVKAKANSQSSIFNNIGSGSSVTTSTTKVNPSPAVSPNVQQSLYDIYKSAYNKTHALSSLDADFQSSATGSMKGIYIYNDSFSGNYKSTSTNAKVQETNSYTDGKHNQSGNLSFYYSNNWEYVCVTHAKEKFSSNITCLENDSNILHVAYCLPESDFKYAKSSTSGGNTVITINPCADSANKLIGDSWNSSFKSGDNSFSDITLEITINSQGFVSSMHIKCNESEPLTNPNNGDPYTLILNDDMQITYKNLGQTVSIEVPSDLASYTQISNPRS